MSADKSDDVMPKVDFNRLKSVDFMHLKQAEEINIQRALKHRELRRKTSIFGLSLALGVLGIYVYTIKTVKQETFLDDFNEPETVPATPNQNQ